MEIKATAKLLLLSAGVAMSVSACAAVEAQRQAQQVKQQQFETRVDLAHVWVTPEDPAPNKPFTELGVVTYTVPFSPDAIDEAKIKDKLKKMAYEKWPETLDALVKEKQDVSSDGNTVTVSALAIQYESSTDRAALHHMNEGMVASPSGQ